MRSESILENSKGNKGYLKVSKKYYICHLCHKLFSIIIIYFSKRSNINLIHNRNKPVTSGTPVTVRGLLYS